MFAKGLSLYDKVYELYMLGSFHHSSLRTLEVVELSFIDFSSPYLPRVLIYMIYEL